MESPMKNMAYWKAKNNISPTKMMGHMNNALAKSQDLSKITKNPTNDMAETEDGENKELIHALKKQDEVKKEVELLKRGEKGGVNTGSDLNI